MRRRFKLDIKKAIEAILYITQRDTDLYKALKIIYFADKVHLNRWGRPITGDWYVAMKLGPVPSDIYNIIRFVRGDDLGIFTPDIEIDEFRADKKHIYPNREPDLRHLSKSDIDCLDEVIAEYGPLTFNELVKKSHADPAYNSVDELDEISFEAIVDTLSNKDDLREHLWN